MRRTYGMEAKKRWMFSEKDKDVHGVREDARSALYADKGKLQIAVVSTAKYLDLNRPVFVEIARALRD